jgi:hypothetical protein
MNIYVSPADIRSFIIGLRPNTSPDNTDLAINKVIEQQAAEIANVAANYGYTLPASTIDPTTNLEYLLWLLDLERPLYVLYLSRSANPDIALTDVAKALLVEAEAVFLDYVNGDLSCAFQNILPITALAQASDILAYISGFNISPNTRIPDSLIERWILAESAFLYTWAFRLGYVVEPYSAFSEVKKALYRDLVVERVASHVLRMRAPQAPQAGLIEQANILYLSSAEKRQKMKNRLFDYALAV